MASRKKTILGIIFVAVIAASLFIRFWRFGEIPPGLNRDEASVGYTAYSLLKTGADEYGKPWPLSFQSFGDWKLPLYIYADIPLVAAFGLQDWVVRLPSALAGLGTLVVIFFLAQELKVNSYLSVLILATLPWHLHFSRMWHEANTALLFLALAALFFLKGLRRPKLWLPATAFLALPLYTYHTHHLFIPLFLGLVIVLFRAELVKNLRMSLAAGAVFLTMAAIIYAQTLTGSLTKSSISFLNDPVFIHLQIEEPRVAAGNSLVAKLIYNRPVIFSKTFLTNYFSSFTYNFLAVNGGNHPLYNLPQTGNIFRFEYLLLGVGLYFALRSRNRQLSLILLWLAIAPIASSLTKPDSFHTNVNFITNTPNSGRLTPMIVPLVLIIAFGAEKIFSLLRKNWQKNLLMLLGAGLLAQGLLGFAGLYFGKFPALRAQYWGAGWQELVNFVNQPENQNKIVVMPRPNYSPYIYFLFYSDYDPARFQKEVVRFPPTNDGFYHVRSFGHFRFEDQIVSSAVLKKTIPFFEIDEDPQQNLIQVKYLY